MCLTLSQPRRTDDREKNRSPQSNVVNTGQRSFHLAFHSRAPATDATAGPILWRDWDAGFRSSPFQQVCNHTRLALLERTWRPASGEERVAPGNFKCDALQMRKDRQRRPPRPGCLTRGFSPASHDLSARTSRSRTSREPSRDEISRLLRHPLEVLIGVGAEELTTTCNNMRLDRHNDGQRSAVSRLSVAHELYELQVTGRRPIRLVIMRVTAARRLSVKRSRADSQTALVVGRWNVEGFAVRKELSATQEDTAAGLDDTDVEERSAAQRSHTPRCS